MKPKNKVLAKFIKKVHKITYFSKRVCIFLRAGPHSCRGSSRKDEASDSSFLRSQYPNAASRIASAFCSGQSKCLSTALSSTYNTKNRKDRKHNLPLFLKILMEKNNND